MFLALAAAAALSGSINSTAPATSPAATSANDICLAMIPPRLATVIAREHPDFVLPNLVDAHADRLMSIASQGGWPCPFVAIADVDGDGNLDRAVILKHKTEPNSRLVIARHIEGEWRLDKQKDWPLSLNITVVEPLEAGLYEQVKGPHNVAAQFDNLNSIQSDHAGFLAGQAEGAKAAHFFQSGKWQELWIEE